MRHFGCRRGNTEIGDPGWMIRDNATAGAMPVMCATVVTAAPTITEPAIVEIVAALEMQSSGRSGIGRRGSGEQCGSQSKSHDAGQGDGYRCHAKGTHYTTYTTQNGQLVHVNLQKASGLSRSYRGFEPRLVTLLGGWRFLCVPQLTGQPVETVDFERQAFFNGSLTDRCRLRHQ